MCFCYFQFLLLQLSCGSYTILTYKVLDCGTCAITNPEAIAKFTGDDATDQRLNLSSKLKRLLQDVEVQSK